MNLEDLVEAHLDGQNPTVPQEMKGEFERALAGHAALQYALGELIAVRDEPSDRPPPVLPEDYEIVRELGRGGMGVVYLVRQKSLGRMVAVKVLRPGETTFGRLVQRFMDEARHLARLRHPNIVSIHEIGHAGEEPYFTMDYVEGEPLSAILARERLSPSRALAILKQAAEGVRHAHAQGIIHRDLKPGNILIDPQGHAYVTDFGLARDMTTTSKVTHSGEVMGTPAYMAPEQAEGRTELIGEATDVHALGAILYEMLTGRAPYGCDAPAHVLIRLLKEEPIRPRSLDRRIPRDLETICLKALAKAPEERYHTVKAFLEDLRRFESGEPLLARRPGVLSHVGRFVRRHWKIAAAVLLPVLLVIAIAPWLFDKTVEQLVAVGDEQRTAGEYQAAIRVYRRALAKATGDERKEILRKMLICCEETRDDKSALEACLLVLESDPRISFGKYDYLVAQAVVNQARALDPNSSVRSVTDRNRAMLKLAVKRLDIFLSQSTGTEEQRKEAQETLVLLDKVLAEQPLGFPTYEERPELPEGTAAELLKRAGDTKLSHWERGKSAYAAGLALEKANDSPAAKGAYKQAFDLMRPFYPAYEGVAFGQNAPPVAESVLFRKVYSAWKRLDPTVPELLQGGLNIRLKGVEVPEGLDMTFQVTLYDPTIKGMDREVQLNYVSRPVRLQKDGTLHVGVADGHYRLTLSKSMWTSAGIDAARRIGTLLTLDPPQPAEVDVHGTYQDVVVPARLQEEIKPLEPADGARVDLQRDMLRWTAAPEAVSYDISFAYKEDTVKSNTFYGLPGVNVSSTSVCLGTLAAKDVPKFLRDSLRPGRTGFWSVTAKDAQGRQIGQMLDNRPFFVARGLGEK